MASEPGVTRDQNIIRLNSVGLSLGTIGKLVGCHATTVTLRLKELNVQPADTRRAFMEDIVKSMSEDQLEWLADQLGPTISIKDYIRNLLVKDYVAAQRKAA
jgi:hypothetical protein